MVEATSVAATQAKVDDRSAEIIEAETDRALKVSSMVSQLAGALNAATAAEMRGALMGVDTTADNAVSQMAGILNGAADTKQVAADLIALDAQQKLTAKELETIKAGVQQAELAASAFPPAQVPAAAGVVTDGTNVFAGATGSGGTFAGALSGSMQTDQGTANLAGGVAGTEAPKGPPADVQIVNMPIAAATADAQDKVKIGGAGATTNEAAAKLAEMGLVVAPGGRT